MAPRLLYLHCWAQHGSQAAVLPEGLTDTAKKNFGGGNTAWEEKTLNMRPVKEHGRQKRKLSEIRLVEIIENLCDNSNFGCNNMVEEHEENIEAWWFKCIQLNPEICVNAPAVHVMKFVSVAW
ncbi:UNVERIFIED_CONTAM: Cysteine-rich with EGF-like domain protein 2-B [Gekko kuhli]